MSSTKKIISALFTLVMLLAICRSAMAQNDLRQEITTLNEQIRGVDQQMAEIKQRLLQQSQNIADLKNRQTDSENPFRNYRLQSALKSAQTLASQLQQLENKKTDLKLQSQATEQLLLASINQQLEQVTARLAQPNVSPQEKRQLSAALAHLVQEQSELNALQKDADHLELGVNNTKNYLPDQNDGLEELTNKAASLRDMQDRIKGQLREINSRMATLQRQQLVFKEARHLMDEEAFFAEMSFAKNNGYLNQQTKNNQAESKLQTDNTTISPQAIEAGTPVAGTTESLATTSTTGDGGTLNGATVTTTFNAIPSGETLHSTDVSSKSIGALPSNEIKTRRVEINQIFNKRNSENVSLSDQINRLRQSEAMLQERVQTIDEHLNIVLSMMHILENTSMPK